MKTNCRRIEEHEKLERECVALESAIAEETNHLAVLRDQACRSKILRSCATRCK